MTTPERKATPVAEATTPVECQSTRSLHVNKIPQNAWRRARRNAVDSGMSFRDYVISLLTSCQPQPATIVGPTAVAKPEPPAS